MARNNSATLLWRVRGRGARMLSRAESRSSCLPRALLATSPARTRKRSATIPALPRLHRRTCQHTGRVGCPRMPRRWFVLAICWQWTRLYVRFGPLCAAKDFPGDRANVPANIDSNAFHWRFDENGIFVRHWLLRLACLPIPPFARRAWRQDSSFRRLGNCARSAGAPAGDEPRQQPPARHWHAPVVDRTES